MWEDLRQRGQEAAGDVVMLAAGLFTLVMLREGGLGAAEPGYRPLDLLGVVLVCTSALPLLLARHFPATVWGVTALSTLVMLALGYGLDVPPGPLVATFVLAEAVGGGLTPHRRLMAGLAVAAYVPVSTVVMTLNGKSVSAMSSGLFAWAAMFGLVWIAGDRSRLRRERIRELEVHARLRQLDIELQRQLAASEERTRIARELHDSAGHAINVILVQAGAARLLHEQDPERSRHAIGTIEEVAAATIADIDRMVRALRHGSAPALPAPAGTDALEQLVDRHRESGLQVTARVEGERRWLPSGVAWAAYRILQEALTNAARHGSGTADVRMTYGPATVDIVVRNPVGNARDPVGSVRDLTGDAGESVGSVRGLAGDAGGSAGSLHGLAGDAGGSAGSLRGLAGDGGAAVSNVRDPGGMIHRPGGGMGLVGMRERVALLDGTLETGADGPDSPDGPDMFRLTARLPYIPPFVRGAST
ncbi:putative two-component system sensor kinase [Actinoplanes missouriensis 431]|uniref:histidine kinase n=1 Tax=Actinoplanes missouriensis (strain ATCC 14538 / DSM 43046 / CBS 188.64 / JCM 3121 / NBRC 102363 / NCIMB 12654 / NRRL B-3342 / UNCC 431) TaxID=512565 RepID=I0H3N5_ACTM4|nr:histidine kinase [Actinoplanes missouriensis]BAL87622.1 putative two-component system sensor kinase [Actinoplanes missouriensis 431]